MTDSRLSSVGNHDLALLRFWRGERKTLKSSQQRVYNELKAHEKRRLSMFLYEVYNENKVVPFGHWPAAEPRRTRHAIGLDTGCVYGNYLTAYIIESDEFISVPAYRAYDLKKSQARFDEEHNIEWASYGVRPEAAWGTR